jgi:hypothetical protein
MEALAKKGRKNGARHGGSEILANDPFLKLILKLAKPRPHWPKDYALNHGYYTKGEPKKKS